MFRDYAYLFNNYEASLQAQQMLAKERTKIIPIEDLKEIKVGRNVSKNIS